MGIKYSSYKRKEIVKKKNIKEFYNLIENSNHGIVMMNEKYEICLYNPEIRRLCGLSPKEITSNVGNSPVKNNKPGGQGLLNLYQPQYKISAFMLIKAIIEEVNKNYTAKTIFLLQNKKNPENIFFGQSYLRRIQIEKQTLTLVSFFPIKDTPFIDPYHSENEATIKKIKLKKSKESNTNNKNNTKEKNKKVKKRTIQKKTKKNSRHSDRYICLSKETNFDLRNKYQPSMIELDSDSDTDQNNNPLNSLNDYENSNYTDDDKENSYGSWVEPLTDFENEPQKNSLNQKQNFNQTNNIQNNIQNQDQMVFLTSAFVMSKLIELNNSNSNSSSHKKTKVFPKELNSKDDSFKGGSFNNIKKNRKNKKSNQKRKTNKKNSTSKKSQTTATNNKNNIQNKSTDNSQTNSNINHNINNTKINKNNNNNTINKNIKTVINNSNTVKNTRDNKIHSNPNNNKNNIDNNNTDNNKNTINNNVLKNRKTVKNIIYKFVINDDQKPEAYLENILPCSKEIDGIFQDYESESNSSDSQLD
ncbi:hypothetical protein M0812_28510 [Anaeramoeba flamelloides]|uniref:PAS domain-containing protein n=1 Tax=Anaeramoeba flamelloides TaxID=1746091 RepID=A0AAV7YDR5_9EUKA|nr:hypothetical protein M0812_28510 [Anaeramoeba flamelloides]